MNGFSFTATCPIDGAPLEPLNYGTTSGWETRATARCTECLVLLVVAVQVVVDRRDRMPTPAKLEQLGRARAKKRTAEVH